MRDAHLTYSEIPMAYQTKATQYFHFPLKIFRWQMQRGESIIGRSIDQWGCQSAVPQFEGPISCHFWPILTLSRCENWPGGRRNQWGCWTLGGSMYVGAWGCFPVGVCVCCHSSLFSSLQICVKTVNNRQSVAPINLAWQNLLIGVQLMINLSLANYSFFYWITSNIRLV